MAIAFAAAMLCFAAFSIVWSPWWLIGFFLTLIFAILEA